jgi:hypothetical protein
MIVIRLRMETVETVETLETVGCFKK